MASTREWGHDAAWVLRALLGIGIFFTTIQGEWPNTGILLMSVGASGIVYYITKHWMGKTAQWMDLFFTLLIVFNNFLGLVLDFYHTIPGWDVATHYTTSLFLAVSALVLIHRGYPQFLLNAPRLLVVVGIVLFSLGLGGLWEIGEFTSDYLRGTDFQGGLTNTMQDLIVDLMAGFVVAIAWVRTQRK